MGVGTSFPGRRKDKRRTMGSIPGKTGKNGCSEQEEKGETRSRVLQRKEHSPSKMKGGGLKNERRGVPSSGDAVEKKEGEGAIVEEKTSHQGIPVRSHEIQKGDT